MSMRSSIARAFAVSVIALPLAAGEITGRVTDAAGAPVSGARVLAAENTVARIQYSTPKGAFAISASASDEVIGTQESLTGEATTGKDGRFRIADLRAGRFSVLAFQAERGFATRLDVACGADLDCALAPPSVVTGRFAGWKLDPTKHVLRFEPRVPFANLALTPNVERGSADDFRVGPLPDVPGWNLILTEWVPERAFSGVLVTEPVDVGPGGSARVVVDLGAGKEVSGVVRGPEGAPLANVSVVARSSSSPVRERGAITDAAGRFRVRGLEDGEWTLDVRRWTTRDTAGCGVGPKDVSHSRAILVGSEPVAPLEITVERLLGSLAVGDLAPGFTVATLGGGTLSLESLRGKVVLIDFWATWCGLCRADLPKLRETYARFGGGKDLEIVAVSIDEDVEAVRGLVKTLGLAWPQTALGPLEKNALAQLYNVAATPSSFLLDREGKIVALHLTGDALRAKIAELNAPK